MSDPYVIAALAFQLFFLGTILKVMGGILTAVKDGFTEVVKGLEALDQKLHRISSGD